MTRQKGADILPLNWASVPSTPLNTHLRPFAVVAASRSSTPIRDQHTFVASLSVHSKASELAGVSRARSSILTYSAGPPGTLGSHQLSDSTRILFPGDSEDYFFRPSPVFHGQNRTSIGVLVRQLHNRSLCLCNIWGSTFVAAANTVQYIPHQETPRAPNNTVSLDVAKPLSLRSTSTIFSELLPAIELESRPSHSRVWLLVGKTTGRYFGVSASLSCN